MFTCPVCAFGGLEYPAEDFTICPCCGTEFGYHDTIRSHAELRAEWIRRGAHWHSRVIRPPMLWNAWDQLIKGYYAAEIPWLHGINIVETATDNMRIEFAGSKGRELELSAA